LCQINMRELEAPVRAQIVEGFVLQECCDRELRLTACDRDLETLVLQACTGHYEVPVRTSAK